MTDRAQEEGQQMFLLRLSDALRERSDPRAAMQAACRLLGEALGADRVNYAEVEGDDYDVAQEYRRSDLTSMAGHYPIASFRPAERAAFEAGHTVAVVDIEAEPDLPAEQAAAYSALGVRSFVSVPLVTAQGLVAVLSVIRSCPGGWSPAEIALIEETAERTWAAVEWARAEVRRRHAEELNAFLVRFTEEVHALTDPWAVAERACQLIADQLGVERCYWAEVDWGTREYVIGASVHLPGVPVIEGRFPVGAWEPFTSLHLAGRPVVVDDAQADERIPAEVKASYAQIAVGADLAVPVVTGGTLRCTLAANQRLARHWTEAEVALVQGLAGRCWSEVERARAEAAVRASRAQFQAVANLVPDLLWESRPDGFTTWYNRRWLDYTGQTFEEATGWGWTDALHPEDLDDSARHYREAMQAGQFLRQEHRIRRHDGEYRWFVVQTFPLRDDRGEVVRVYGAATDIHHLRERSSVLEARVEERTRRLSDLNAELGNLIIRTAHNLEEPARTLGHLLDPGRPVDPHALDGLSPYDPTTLAAEVSRLRGIAQDLRQLSRLETHALSRDLLPLGEVVATIQAKVAATPRGQQMHWFIDPLPIVRGDRTLLTQALDVLMTFTLSETRGARHVVVSSREVEGEVQVTVEDDGIGLSGEEAATLFDLAVRTDQAVPVMEGSGLIQVRRILARHGGWAWAEAQRSSGKVVLAFPRDTAVTELEGLFRQDKPGQ
ncbi:PAS domain S-box-containing protein [Deinococcus metalli]|uniref:histidine kinase n=1 Tax=Deinococcus metalli TaxID=1141878 RepID=A0A7W8KHY8_9DEIO|nr:GAF domain-containing protein [Deinococcus metalli]MBB5378118.1 PAS domain S-box-containing protein [Deinococcus metalli]GHF54582.1 hypothetical protein GCM10017781_33630 [Deinococcus metalli]